jgi:hypothetical protein
MLAIEQTFVYQFRQCLPYGSTAHVVARYEFGFRRNGAMGRKVPCTYLLPENFFELIVKRQWI